MQHFIQTYFIYIMYMMSNSSSLNMVNEHHIDPMEKIEEVTVRTVHVHVGKQMLNKNSTQVKTIN